MIQTHYPSFQESQIDLSDPAKRHILKNLINFFTNIVVSPNLFSSTSKIDVRSLKIINFKYFYFSYSQLFSP